MNIQTRPKPPWPSLGGNHVFAARQSAGRYGPAGDGGFKHMFGGLSNGMNFSITPPAGWTVSAGATNIQRGPANGTNAGTPLNPYNGAAVGANNVTTCFGDISQTTVGNREVNTFTAKNLDPGTYNFQVSLYNSQNLDAIGLTPAVTPQPSSLISAIGGRGLLLPRDVLAAVCSASADRQEQSFEAL